jgi:hypothetical protein
MTLELRVPKDVVAAELALAGEAPRRVELFVVAGRGLAEMLEHEAPFFPVREVGGAAGGAIVNKAALAWIAVAIADADDGELYSERRVVRVELAGGEALEGELLYSPAEGRARVVDQLNEEGRFVRLWQAERVWFVNKLLIARVIEKGA